MQMGSGPSDLAPNKRGTSTKQGGGGESQHPGQPAGTRTRGHPSPGGCWGGWSRCWELFLLLICDLARAPSCVVLSAASSSAHLETIMGRAWGAVESAGVGWQSGQVTAPRDRAKCPQNPPRGARQRGFGSALAQRGGPAGSRRGSGRAARSQLRWHGGTLASRQG